LPQAMRPLHRQELAACRLLREDRTARRLGRKPHIVPPGKRAQPGRRNWRIADRSPSSLPLISSPREAISSPPGNLRPQNIVRPRKIYRLLWEPLPSCRGTNHVCPGKSYRPLWEDISSSRGKLIVLPRKLSTSFACKSTFFSTCMHHTLCICFCLMFIVCL
jgi:hypothetical protein